MDGMTGFNPDAALQQLTDLDYYLDDTYRIFRSAYDVFMYNLSSMWYSSKAVEFSNNALNYKNQILGEYNKAQRIIMSNSVAAYNILARSNNYSSTSAEALNLVNLDGDRGHDYNETAVANWVKEVGPSGEVGMNITLVKSFALPEFEKEINRFYTALDETPLDIEFYDPNGELKAKYKELINGLKLYIMDEVNTMLFELRYKMDDEIDNIEIAKEQATDAMNVAA